MRQTNHSALGHAGQLIQHVLDLAAGDVLATALDHVFLTIDNCDEALTVHGAQIPAVEPATGEHLGGALSVVVVTLQ